MSLPSSIPAFLFSEVNTKNILGERKKVGGETSVVTHGEGRGSRAH